MIQKVTKWMLLSVWCLGIHTNNECENYIECIIVSIYRQVSFIFVYICQRHMWTNSSAESSLLPVVCFWHLCINYDQCTKVTKDSHDVNAFKCLLFDLFHVNYKTNINLASAKVHFICTQNRQQKAVYYQSYAFGTTACVRCTKSIIRSTCCKYLQMPPIFVFKTYKKSFGHFVMSPWSRLLCLQDYFFNHPQNL